MENQTKLNLSVIAKQYSDEESAYKFLESVRWENGVVCPHCESVNQSQLIETRDGELRATRKGNKTYRRVWLCQNCKKQFSALVGTIFSDSHIPLSKWLLAIHELNADKNGVSSHELGRKLGVTQKSAWFMAHRIREAMTNSPLAAKLNGTVEADETYIGGKEKNKHANKKQNLGRGTVGKTPVFSILERGGEIRSVKVDNVNGTTVGAELNQNVDSSASLMTDTSPVYTEIGKEFAKHETVDHGAGEYVRGDVHINSLEGYYGQFKPSLVGTYRHISTKHLHRYLGEFDKRYNTRKNGDGSRTLGAIKQAKGKRLTYAALIQKNEEIHAKD